MVSFDHFLGRFEDGATIERVAKELRPLLAIVKVTETGRKPLDFSVEKGWMGWKATMPEEGGLALPVRRGPRGK